MLRSTKGHAASSRLLASYTDSLGNLVSRRRSETALAAAKVEAELASRAKTEFLANMSHELRTPLNAIIGFAQVLRDGIGIENPSDRQKEYVEHIHTAGKHLLGIITDILDIAKIENNKFELDLDAYEMDRVLADCAALVNDRFRQKEQTFTVDVEEGLPALIVDRRRLKQIIINLLSNAHKFTPKGGTIQIQAVTTRHGGVDISVHDTGVGMTGDEIQTALQPFGQIQSAYSRDHEGTGLGIPIAKGLMALHGGTFNIVSRRNVGTTVTLSFPAEAVVASSVAADPASPPPLARHISTAN